ncbi:MAG TPA: hypothetical protein DIC24_06320 [Gammaproteobacteria bacterium]|nr:MAG: hypothetical protein CND88_00665 [Candidatus Thioglobus sp. MED-G23]HBP85280.1 hypothetical protein [Gammaproteobacteria bacterium]HCL94225.1 hypothetical protein [Gammaproteobacteria bacterium]
MQPGNPDCAGLTQRLMEPCQAVLFFLTLCVAESECDIPGNYGLDSREYLGTMCGQFSDTFRFPAIKQG